MKGVHDCHAVRIRPSGARWFVDLHITMDGRTTLTESHRITERIEKKVRSILKGSDVTVHVEPLEMAEN
jgi:divalent metal cation (Fe/Co/Zn/Cd) transporter